jgi:hypothetical protein
MNGRGCCSTTARFAAPRLTKPALVIDKEISMFGLSTSDIIVLALFIASVLFVVWIRRQ